MSTPAPDSEVTQDQPRWFVVCGDDSLAFRLAEELRLRHNGQVAVILPSRLAAYGPRIAKLDGVRIVESTRPDADAFLEARLDLADGLALVSRDDVANIDAALLGQEINPRLRIVLRMFNASLAEGVSRLPSVSVLSDTEIAAPAFVAAAIDDTSSRMTLRNTSVFVARRSDARNEEILCGLAVTEGVDEAELLPADQAAADLVLVRARAPERPRGWRRRPLRHHYPVRATVRRIVRRVSLVLAAFAGVLALGAVALAWIRGDLNWWQAAYTSMIFAFGGADPDLATSTAQQATQTALAVLSLALIPLLTATVVDAVVRVRLELAERSLTNRATGHIVVAGLGGVGSHIVEQLHGLGFDVVAIDSSPTSRGSQVARQLRIPLIVGDANRRDTLSAASVQTCRTLIAITSNDANNLETALIGRTLNPDVHVVLRLFDGDFADRIQRAFSINVSRSVSYLAAPIFAANLLGQVPDTIPIGRHVLLVAELTIEPYAALEGQTVAQLRRPNEAWLVEVVNQQGQRLPSQVASGRRLQRTDTLLVVATRRGLARLIAEASAPAEATPRGPLVLHDSSPFDPPAPRPST